jgi:hypothetical protein
MPTESKIRIKDYYDLTPPIAHNAGDIWSGLPTHGFIEGHNARAIVITPACDLSQQKAWTATYLPIVPINEYLLLPSFHHEILSKTNNLLSHLEVADYLASPCRFSPPPVSDLKILNSKIDALASQAGLGSKQQQALPKAKAGIKLLLNQHNESLEKPSMEDVQLLFGEKDLRAKLAKVISNSYALDIHFLPADGQSNEWSGILNHSVVLFRYAFSVPMEILDRAQDINEKSWSDCTERLKLRIPGVACFHETRPLKHISLKPRFLSDLLTRFVSLYVRIGSPDFSPQTINEYSSDIIGGQA